MVRYAVRKDGNIVSVHDTHNQAWVKILGSQSASVDHAMRHEGWSITEVSMGAAGLVVAFKDTDWGRCDRCGSDHIEGGNLDVEDNNCWQVITCQECALSWAEVYTALQREHYFDEEGLSWPK